MNNILTPYQKLVMKVPRIRSLSFHLWHLVQPYFLLILSTGLFVFTVSKINLRAMTDIGIVSILPVSIYLSLFLLTFSFIWCLHRSEQSNFILLLHVILLVFILHGITVPVEELPRFNVTWRHAGIIDYILRNHAVNPRIDAYFNWPGFFILSAFVMELMGLKDPIQLAFWPSVFNSLLYIGPLILILRSVTENRKLIWYGLWLFFLANWIGQDYFAPQALNFFIYITILGILLWCFRGSQALPWLERIFKSVSQRIVLSETQEQQAIVRGRNTARRRRLIGLIVILFAALFSVASHQLTPFAILISIAVLSVFNQISVRGLGYIIAVMTLTWLAFMAVPYMQQRTDKLLSDVGRVDEALTANVTDRLSGSSGHNIIVKVRLLETAFFWGLAFLGGLRRLNRNYFDLIPVLLALPPFTLLILQFYGGEMLLRVYLFTLPFMVFFVSGLIYTDLPEKWVNWQPWLAGMLSILLISTFYLSRYGNEKIDQFTQKEVEAVNYVYKIAEPGALIAAPSPHYPIKYQGYELYSVKFYDEAILAGDVNILVQAMDAKQARESFFIITTSQESYFQLFYSYLSKNWQDFEAKMISSGRFELIYSNEDARVYKLLKIP
ncbi:MAG TPA: hypothetical protein VFR47_09655 [Anaerolineales bacterium]|nr:hypothetical protein [Anaerolineales bacterium]